MNELPLIALIIGLALVTKHLLALLAPAPFKIFLEKFPRSRAWGIALLLIATAWAFLVTTTTDLGEFSSLRMMILTGIAVGGGLFSWLVPEFLAVRSLGFILLLLAHPMLEITFLKSGLLPLLVSLLAYAWIIGGLFMVGMPYLLRNFITFISAPDSKGLWNFFSCLGLIYGFLLLVQAGLQLLQN